MSIHLSWGGGHPIRRASLARIAAYAQKPRAAPQRPGRRAIFARPHSAFDFSNSIEKLHHGFLIATRCLIRELGDGCLQRRNASGFTVDVYSDFVASRLHDQSREVFRSLWPPLWIARRALAKLRALWRFTAADLRLKPTYDFHFFSHTFPLQESSPQKPLAFVIGVKNLAARKLAESECGKLEFASLLLRRFSLLVVRVSLLFEERSLLILAAQKRKKYRLLLH